jgi:hypothetical protein
MSGNPGPVGTLDVALAHAERLLATDPALAAAQVSEILAAVPGHPLALLLLGVSRRVTGDVAGALAVLEPWPPRNPTGRPCLTSSASCGCRPGKPPSRHPAAALKPVMPDASGPWRTTRPR